MSEATLLPEQRPRRFHFEWTLPTFIRPRHTFKQISLETRGVWQTAILILTLTAILNVVGAGLIRQSDPAASQVELPPDFEYYTPEMQAQYMQAAQLTSGPVFVYVFPAITGVLGVWIGWLIVGGLVHLLLTLLGGRGSTTHTMNIAAWAMLPLALRDLVRLAATVIGGHAITSPGVSGFIAADAAGFSLYLKHLLGLVDLYVVWRIALLIIGVQAGDSLPAGRVIVSISILMILLLLAQAALGFLVGSLGSLTVVRPFFF